MGVVIHFWSLISLFYQRGGSEDLWVLIGRGQVSSLLSPERVVLISEVIMAYPSPAKGKEVFSSNFHRLLTSHKLFVTVRANKQKKTTLLNVIALKTAVVSSKLASHEPQRSHFDI